MPEQGSSDAGDQDLRPFTSRLSEKWLNVVLDLNGVLCVCEDKRYHTKDQRFVKPEEVIPNLESFTVGVKKVVIRPFCPRVLRELSKIANLSVWSSMKRSTVIEICNVLFKGLDPPLHVFGQEQCDIVKCKLNNGRIGNYKTKGTNKDLFLKPLEKLFEMSDSVFGSENTLIVDDSPEKHITNHPKNVILLETWSYLGYGGTDGILIDHLLPYIQRLHVERPEELYPFRRDNIFGRLHLFYEEDQTEYKELTEAVKYSNRLFLESIVGNPRSSGVLEESRRPTHREVKLEEFYFLYYRVSISGLVPLP